MKAGWEVRPLGETSRINPPKAEARKRLTGDAYVSFAPMDVLPIGVKSFAASEERKLSKVAGSYTYFSDGDVLLAKITPCFENGKLSIAGGLRNGVGFGSSEFLVIRPDPLAINTEYLFYYLSQDEFRAAGAAQMRGAVGHKRVPKEFIEGHSIPLPPLDEQRRIVAVLDEAFEGLARARANIEANLADAKEAFRVASENLFAEGRNEWAEVKVSSLGSVQTGSTPPTNRPAFYGGDLPFVKPGDFRTDGTIDTSGNGLSVEGRAASRVIPANSVLMVCIGATIGKVGHTSTEVTANQQINSLTPRDADAEFLYYQMRTFAFQAAVIEQAGQATLPIINKKKWASLPLFVPFDRTQQRAVASLLRSLSEELRDATLRYTAQLADLAILRQTLLARAFRGELT